MSVTRAKIVPWPLGWRPNREAWDIAKALGLGGSPTTVDALLSASPGFRWRLRGQAKRMKARQAERGLILVSEVVGKNRDLVASGQKSVTDFSQPFEARGKSVFLCFARPGPGIAGTKARP